MSALDEDVTLPDFTFMLILWWFGCRLMFLNAALLSFYTPIVGSREVARPAWSCPFITHLDQSLALCALLWHISISKRFTLAACQRPSRWAFFVPARKLCAFAAAVIYSNDVNARWTARFSHQSLLPIAIHLFGTFRVVGPSAASH